MSALSRRDFMQISSGGVIASLLSAAQDPGSVPPADKNIVTNEKGDQRLSLKKLKAWEQLGYGMFIHFGMSTFDGDFYPCRCSTWKERRGWCLSSTSRMM